MQRMAAALLTILFQFQTLILRFFVTIRCIISRQTDGAGQYYFLIHMLDTSPHTY